MAASFPVQCVVSGNDTSRETVQDGLSELVSLAVGSEPNPNEEW